MQQSKLKNYLVKIKISYLVDTYEQMELAQY